jgi:L-lactate dehydrogenase complex protein LldF
MSTARERTDDDGAMLHPELRAEHDPDAIIRDGRRLDHAEATSKPLRSRAEADRSGGSSRALHRRP